MGASAVGYVAASAALVVAVAAMLSWAVPPELSEADSATDSVRAAGVIVDQRSPVETATAADAAIAGVGAQILRRSGMPTDPANGVSAPRPCGKSFGGWISADAARAVDSQRSLTVTASVWRAGAGVAAYRELRTVVEACAEIVELEGEDEFLATTAPSPGERTVAAVRLGDTLTIVESSTIDGGSVGAAESALTATREVVGQRLAGICAAPGSRRVATATMRDPYGGSYRGNKVSVGFELNMDSLYSQPQVRRQSAANSGPVWKPPEPESFLELAPLDLEELSRYDPADLAAAYAAGAGGTLAGLPRLDPPEFIDPAALAPPTASRPLKDPGESPRLPSDPKWTTSVQIPVVDPVGPGCGWAFTGTQSALTDPRKLDTTGRALELDALISLTKQQTEWLVDAASWPSTYQNWLTRRRAEDSWNRYENTLKEALADQAEATRRYQESVDRWLVGDLPTHYQPSVSASPSTSATPTPELTPSTSPQPSASESSGGSE